MTRGRTGQWADTPLAIWIRQRLNGRPKKWLIAQLVQRGRSLTAASGWVNRATKRGEPATAAQLHADYAADLTAIFGDDPRTPDAAGLVAEVERLRADLDDAQRRLTGVEAQLPQRRGNGSRTSERP